MIKKLLALCLYLCASKAFAVGSITGGGSTTPRISDAGTGTDLVIGDANYNRVLIGNTDGFGQLVVDPDNSQVNILGGNLSVDNGRLFLSSGLSPLIEGVGDIGGAADPFARIYLGTNSIRYTLTDSLATYRRFVHFPDKTGTFVFLEAGETPPRAPTVTAGEPGTNLLSLGDYSWKVTFVTAAGETSAGDPSATDLVGTLLPIDPATQLPPVLTDIPIGSALVTARKIYRTNVGSPDLWYLVDTLADNTTTTYTDNTPDASLGAAIPSSNATLSRVDLSAASVFLIDGTVTASGTTGTQTINKAAGAVNFAAGNSSKQVNNSSVVASSIIVATAASHDATLTAVQAVAANGSFTLYGNAAATGETRVNWFVITP